MHLNVAFAIVVGTLLPKHLCCVLATLLVLAVVAVRVVVCVGVVLVLVLVLLQLQHRLRTPLTSCLLLCFAFRLVN